MCSYMNYNNYLSIGLCDNMVSIVILDISFGRGSGGIVVAPIFRLDAVLGSRLFDTQVLCFITQTETNKIIYFMKFFIKISIV